MGSNPNKQNKKKVSLVDKVVQPRKKKKVHETPYANTESGETAYAVITHALGDMRFRVKGITDEKIYQGKTHIKRRVKSSESKGSNRINISDLVLISFREFQNYDISNQVDIIYKYYPDEIDYMIRTKELPYNYDKGIHGTNPDEKEEDYLGFVFDEPEITQKDSSEHETDSDETDPDELVEQQKRLTEMNTRLKKEMNEIDLDAI